MRALRAKLEEKGRRNDEKRRGSEGFLAARSLLVVSIESEKLDSPCFLSIIFMSC